MCIRDSVVYGFALNVLSTGEVTVSLALKFSFMTNDVDFRACVEQMHHSL